MPEIKTEDGPVTALRRTLVQAASHWNNVSERNFELAEHLDETDGGRITTSGTTREFAGAAMMASSYSYVLAAVLRIAEQELDPGAAELLTENAALMLENGDFDQINADVTPGGHKCAFPCNPPGGTMWAPGPCRICGKTWDRAQAENALAEARAAMAATEAEAVETEAAATK